jgi:hypothetical protein
MIVHTDDNIVEMFDPLEYDVCEAMYGVYLHGEDDLVQWQADCVELEAARMLANALSQLHGCISVTETLFTTEEKPEKNRVLFIDKYLETGTEVLINKDRWVIVEILDNGTAATYKIKEEYHTFVDKEFVLYPLVLYRVVLEKVEDYEP